MNLQDEIESTRRRLGLKKYELAAAMGITPEWYGRVISAPDPVPEGFALRYRDFMRRQESEQSSIPENSRRPEFISQVQEPHAPYGVVASRIQTRRGPSTRADCEAYVRELFDRAEASANPNAFPAIYETLQEELPLSKYPPAEGAAGEKAAP